MDIARAREALEDLLKSNASSQTSVRYYVKLALSHMQDDVPVRVRHAVCPDCITPEMCIRTGCPNDQRQ